ncbi:hypothetical protein ACFRCQ_09965 [Cytobacillus firmus]|uniref:hypothetical protein n=1 Tax=Cytobacillus firmus TaxID=1399 RepID=UPI0036ADEFCA
MGKKRVCSIKEGMKGYIFKVLSDTNVLNVYTLKTAHQIAKKYLIETFMSTSIYDYERMSKEYDAINIKGEALLSNSPFSEWNVESTLWLNVSGLKILDTIDVFAKYKK